MVRSNIREAYEQGISDSKRGIFEEAISDAVDTVNEEMGMGYDEDELAAYYKGRNGEQLDEDKDDDDDDDD